ncbi:MAG: NusG domain II-containing protein [Oscillospiraceae bacterium]|nr:NusG domain II-containing protein [Oscillospiraceae bacterium]
MNKSPDGKPNKYDALVVLVVLALAAALGARVWFAPKSPAAELVVSVGNTECERIPFDDTEREYTNNGYTVHLAVTPDGAWVDHADCPTQDCVRTGVISRPGQSIVCLPARIVIAVEGAEESGWDAIAG